MATPRREQPDYTAFLRTRQKELWHLCQTFVRKNDITHEETVYQTDRVAENSLEFIEAICHIVGFLETHDDDEESN